MTPSDHAAPSIDQDAEKTARSIVLAQLARAPRTRAQLQTELDKRKVPPAVAEQVLDRFAEVGLIDDQAYAEALIRSESASGGLSKRRVRHRLREKGVPEEIVAGAVGGIDTEAELDSALALARRRAARMTGLDPVSRRRRLAGVLARRGFDAAVVRTVLETVLEPDSLPGDEG